MKTVPWAEPIFTFAEVLTATDAENTWLRTIIARNRGGIGTKHRMGRLMFSLKDIAAVSVLWGLNGVLRIPPAAAWQVIAAVEQIIVRMDRPGGDADIRISFDAKGDVLIWTVPRENFVYTWNDNTSVDAAHAANEAAHIVLPMKSLFRAVGAATQLAQAWPDEAEKMDQEAQEAEGGAKN